MDRGNLVTRRPRRDTGPAGIIARFDGICVLCDDPYVQEDWITLVRGAHSGYAHTACAQRRHE